MLRNKIMKVLHYLIIAIVLSGCANQSDQIGNMEIDDFSNQEKYDITSKPPGVLSQTIITRQWDAYKNQKSCLERNPGAEPEPIRVSKLSDNYLAAKKLNNIFNKSEGNLWCSALDKQNAPPPSPIKIVDISNGYGDRNSSLDQALDYLQKQSSLIRFTNSSTYKDELRETLVNWAKNKSLRNGIRSGAGNEKINPPVNFYVLTLVESILAATSEVVDDFTPDEKVIVYKWLNEVVIDVGNSTYWYRSDNKEYLKAYIVLLWAIMVDDQKLIQKVINVYKNAIHEMRPDGSFPIDSQRGAMGNHYTYFSTHNLTLIAALLKQKKNIDLFSYEVEGRSIHSAVEYVVQSIKDQSNTNKKYALPCFAGDRWGSVDNPSHWFQKPASGVLSVYASIFPEKDASIYIDEKYALDKKYLILSEISGGAPYCQFKF